MSVISALCLLVVLTSYRDISVLAGIGDTCATTNDCTLNNAVCVDQVCACNNDFVADSGSTQCLPKVGHGQSCLESIQCVDLLGAECVSNTCQCTSNFNFNGIRCVGNIALGQPCNRDAECVVPNDLRQETVWCFGGQCSCRNGFRREGDICVIGGDCTNDDDCRNLTNSRCDVRPRDRHQCECLPDHIPLQNNTRCLPIAPTIGSGCEFDEQCSRRLGTAVCTNNQCRCADGTRLTNNNTCGAAIRVALSLSCFVLVWVVKLL